MLALIAERIGGEAGTDALERVDKNFARLVVLHLVEFKLVGRHAAADTDIEPAVAQMIEHADFLDQPQRRIKWQQINQRSKPHALGGACHGAEIDARDRHHAERGGVMLGDVQAIDTGGVGGFGKSQPFVKQPGQRPFAVLDVIEKPDFHGASSPSVVGVLTGFS
jgi:hypothetical protein